MRGYVACDETAESVSRTQDFEFKGRDLYRLEEVNPATGATIG